MKKIVTLLLCSAAALTGCLKNEDEPTRDITYKYVGVETLSVASEEGYYIYAAGGHSSTTMLRSAARDYWFAGWVEGFDFEPGYEYTLLVDKYKVVLPDLPMCYDGPYEKYKLKEVVSKTERDTEGIAWYMPCYDVSQFIPDPWPTQADERLTVIRTADEYSTLVAPADDKIEAVFEGHNSMLLISGQSPRGIAWIGKRLTYTGGGHYSLVIDIHYSLTTNAPTWTVAVLVPAIPEGAVIDVQVNYI
ncbi:MAG: DUF4377 domain-containing protein [Rikenellaceae bacterium]|jgi:hypothetical protein|nr:DUF4377 domain-containing protein [Rikenellaceae bacterium]